MNRTLTAALLIVAAVLTNLAFTALSSVFGYPDVLKEPVDDVLRDFRADQTAVSVWFTVLAISSALFVPISLGVRRLAPTSRAMRWAVVAGIGAGVVQVIGLMRWPLLIPGFAADATSSDPAVAAAARDHFLIAHHLLGNLIGETFGYLLTAAWTLLVIAALRRRFGLWFDVLGGVSAVLVLSGVLSPLDLPGIDLANFVGYVLWSFWLVAFAIILLVRAPRSVVATELTGAVR